HSANKLQKPPYHPNQHHQHRHHHHQHYQDSSSAALESKLTPASMINMMEVKVREVDDPATAAATVPRSATPTPSVKARKFGRSVVNLLRSKSGYAVR
ncbi:hypothetical protein LTR28_008685, partial [Elasticomyces elasticus]